jgi:ABC-type phosphonate transport system ATPase subunit
MVRDRRQPPAPQLKRLTIAVELVSNPSIVFMDEPISGEFQRLSVLDGLACALLTLCRVGPSNPAHAAPHCLSGLDARAAAIVMSAVRNVALSGRTVMVTMHQPTTELFEVGVVVRPGSHPQH